MFCPVCKYEFRRGFTHCNECDVDLVDALPPEEEVDHTAPTAAATLDHPTLLWSGASGAIYSALTHALDEADIPYNKEELDARLVFTSQHGDLEVWVPVSNLPQAQPILQSILANPLNSAAAQDHYIPADEENDASATLADESDEGAHDIRMDNAARELYPDEATVEVWAGADENMAEVLKSCLAEVGVACYIHRPGFDDESGSHSESAAASDATSDEFAVFVLPQDESRAIQIVRQITDAAPPE